MTKMTFEELKAKVDEKVKEDRKSGKFDKPIKNKTLFAPLCQKLICEKWPV